MKDITLEQKVQRALDYMEIQNVMALHTYYYYAQKQWEELDNVWSKRDDIAYGPMHQGREAVRGYYGATNEDSRKEKLNIMAKLFPDIEVKEENEGMGDMVIHLLTTPYVEIAKDGQTAKGVWYSPGICTEVGKDGQPVPMTMWERCGADFIKEDGEWKIWHFRQYGDFAALLDKWVVDGSRPGPGRTAFAPPPPPQEGNPAMPPHYTVKRVPRQQPYIPKPYDTWDDSMSYIND